MKRFDLNAMGVQEMSHSEMVKTDGGIGLLAVALLSVISSVIVVGCGNNVNTEKKDSDNNSNNGDKNTGNGNGNKDNGSNNGTNNQKK